MKIILLFCFLFISCTNTNIKYYIPQEIETTDTITKLINNERKNLNLNELKSESLLIELSKQKVIQMKNNKEINHNGFTELKTNTEIYSQIVGYGYKNEINLFNSYITSNEHKDKILGNFTHIGSFTYENYNCILFAKY